MKSDFTYMSDADKLPWRCKKRDRNNFQLKFKHFSTC